MSLFQKSVQKKYINALDKFKVEAAYQRLLTHFVRETVCHKTKI